MIKIFNLLIIFAVMISTIACNSNKEVIGIINARGHEPFVYLSIETNDGEIFEIESPDSLQKQLWEFQGLEVTLEISDVKKNIDREVIIVKNYKLNSKNNTNIEE